jgi:hypothetical protein
MIVHLSMNFSRRLIPICPTLRAWLRACRDDSEDVGSTAMAL